MAPRLLYSPLSVPQPGMPPSASPVPSLERVPCSGFQSRVFFIDNLRMTLCALVIIHHSAIAYGALGGWFYLAREPIGGAVQAALSTMLALNQAYFMSLFLFIAAFLMPESLGRKGHGAFIKDRLIRLGIPLLIYTLLVHPTILYATGLHTHRAMEPLPKFIWHNVAVHPNTGHMWFVLTLLGFEIVYVTLGISRLKTLPWLPQAGPRQWQVVVFVISCGLVAFALRQVFPLGTNFLGLQLGYFSLYVGMYAWGIVAGHKRWLAPMSWTSARVWFALSIMILPFVIQAVVLVQRTPELIRTYAGGPHWQALLLACWESVTCVGICGFLWSMFQRHLDSSGPLAVRFSRDTYGAYIIHPVPVVGCTFLLEGLKAPPITKFLFVSLFGIILSYSLAHALRALPGFRRVL